jgi:hypothetical protein
MNWYSSVLEIMNRAIAICSDPNRGRCESLHVQNLLEAASRLLSSGFR